MSLLSSLSLFLYLDQIIRPKDQNPFAQETYLGPWQSEYQGTIGATATHPSSSPTRPDESGTKNQFLSKPSNFYWDSYVESPEGDLEPSEQSHENYRTVVALPHITLSHSRSLIGLIDLH
jgi:hypothetical protein